MSDERSFFDLSPEELEETAAVLDRLADEYEERNRRSAELSSRMNEMIRRASGRSGGDQA